MKDLVLSSLIILIVMDQNQDYGDHPQDQREPVSLSLTTMDALIVVTWEFAVSKVLYRYKSKTFKGQCQKSDAAGQEPEIMAYNYNKMCNPSLMSYFGCMHAIIPYIFCSCFSDFGTVIVSLHPLTFCFYSCIISNSKSRLQ